MNEPSQASKNLGHYLGHGHGRAAGHEAFGEQDEAESLGDGIVEQALTRIRREDLNGLRARLRAIEKMFLIKQPSSTEPEASNEGVECSNCGERRTAPTPSCLLEAFGAVLVDRGHPGNEVMEFLADVDVDSFFTLAGPLVDTLERDMRVFFQAAEDRK